MAHSRDLNQQLFKGFGLPLLCVFEVEVTNSEDMLRLFVVHFSLHTNEVSQVLLMSTRLQQKTNSYAKKSQTKAFTCF